jgi:hypothetical protein
MTFEVTLPRPEVRGVGHVIYRCATCRDEIMDPWFSDGVTTSHAIPDNLTPDLRAYHQAHLPKGVTNGE